MTHICVDKLTMIGSDNGLSPGRRQAIIWTIAWILLTWTLGTNFSEILIEIHTFSFKKIYLKMSSAKWLPFYLGLNVLPFKLTHMGNYKIIERIAHVNTHKCTSNLAHMGTFGIVSLLKNATLLPPQVYSCKYIYGQYNISKKRWNYCQLYFVWRDSVVVEWLELVYRFVVRNSIISESFVVNWLRPDDARMLHEPGDTWFAWRIAFVRHQSPKRCWVIVTHQNKMQRNWDQIPTCSFHKLGLRLWYAQCRSIVCIQ